MYRRNEYFSMCKFKIVFKKHTAVYVKVDMNIFYLEEYNCCHDAIRQSTGTSGCCHSDLRTLSDETEN